MLGQTLGHYRIESKLGEGGMGVVYKALDTHLNRAVAIKVLPAQAVADSDRRQRFIQEARAASALDHPNIITIHDIAEIDGQHFIVMQYVAGKTLRELLHRGALPLKDALRYAVQIADALTQAHARGIVHRDLKPENIMVSEEGQVKILDFGLAKLTEPEAAPENELGATLSIKSLRMARTEMGVILGTVAYMSPEQAEGKKVDARSDIFSFGSILYEMVTGRQAFQGETKISTLAAILREEPQPASQIVQPMPRELEKITARCLRKDLAWRFQHMGDVKIALEELREETASGTSPATPAVPAAASRGRASLFVVSAAVLLAAALGFGAGWWMLSRRTATPVRPPVLTRLTSDSGLTTDPALSPDGKLLAFASDRSGEGSLDIWVRQIGRGEPLRLTRDEADEYDPAFSPDGTQITFRSEREGGGVYVVPALGGEPRLIAKDGRRPRFSPDGNWVAYWTGPSFRFDSTFPGAYKIFVVPCGGGAPRQLAGEFALARFPIWSPDGKQLLFYGRRSPSVSDEATRDWWITPLDGGPTVQTGALHPARPLGLSRYNVPGAWIGDAVFFSATVGDATNLWKIVIPQKTGKAASAPQRVTFGAGIETQPSIASGPDGTRRLAFASLVESVNIWSLPIDADQGKTTGEMQRLTESAARDLVPSLSADGSKLAFVSNRAGISELWLKDLPAGKETALVSLRFVGFWPILSADGSRLAYTSTSGERDKFAGFVLRTRGGVPQKVCEECGSAVSWSHDGTKILTVSLNQPRSMSVIDVASGKSMLLLKHPGYSLYGGPFSPDDRWIAFAARSGPAEWRLFILPFRGISGASPEEKEWIPVGVPSAEEANAQWSPNGSVLYFFSQRDGFRCIWGQRLNPRSKGSVGPAFALFHSHHARRSLMSLDPGEYSLGASRNRLVFPLDDSTGNIWLADLEKDR